MEQRIKRDRRLVSLVNEFEAMSETGNLTYLNEKTFNQLISYYQGEFLIDKALEVVDMAMSQFQYRVEFYVTKAKLLIRDQQFNEALQIIEEASNISPSENELVILKARCIGALGNDSEALSLLNSIKGYASKLDLCDIYTCESYVYETNKKYSKMFEVLKAALRIDPLSLEALERMWISIELSKNYEESITFHNELLEVNPYNFLAWYNLGHAYSCLGEYEKAISSMEYSFIINENFDIAYLECADICCQISDYKKALSIYEEANANFGPDSELLVQIAECHLKLENLLSAKANLFSALRLDLYNDEIYFLLGECYLKEKSLHSAISAYKKAIDLEDGREEYYEGIGKAYVQLGDNNTAAQYFDIATEIAPEQEFLWYQYTSILVKLGRVGEALQILDEAEDYAVGPELLYCRAVCLSLLGQKKEALVILDEALIDNFEMHNKLFDLDPSLKFDKDILSIIHYYEGEPKM